MGVVRKRFCGMNPLPTGRQAQPFVWGTLGAVGGVGSGGWNMGASPACGPSTGG